MGVYSEGCCATCKMIIVHGWLCSRLMDGVRGAGKGGME